MRPLRLLLIITGIDRRGAERHVLALARGFAAQGWQVMVAYWGGRGELAADFRAAAVSVHRLDFRGKVNPGSLAPFVRLILTTRPDVVHTHLPLAEFYGNLAAGLCRVPAIVSTKHSDHALFRRPLVRLGHVVMSASNGAVIAVSEHMARFIRSVGLWPGTRLLTIPNGLDVADFDQAWNGRVVQKLRSELAPSEGWLIGAAGRLEPEKGLDNLIAAMPRILRQVPEARLAIAGEGSCRPRLEALVHRLGLVGRVRLLGARADFTTLVHAFDVFALPSRAEPFGLVLLEAMAARRAVVATSVGGVPEVVVPGETGDLVPSDDHVALADSLVGLKHDPDRARLYGEAGRRRVEQVFPLNGMLAATERLYREFLVGKLATTM